MCGGRAFWGVLQEVASEQVSDNLGTLPPERDHKEAPQAPSQLFPKAVRPPYLSCRELVSLYKISGNWLCQLGGEGKLMLGR